MRFGNVKHVPLFIQHGLDLKSFKYEGLGQFSAAINLSGIDIVKSLLKTSRYD